MEKGSEDNKMTGYRWIVCAMLFFATTINYLDRQVLSLTWSEFIAPEFHWNDNHYGTISALFSIFYAFSMLFVGKFVDWIDTKKGFLWSIGVWSVGAIMHAGCGIITQWIVGISGKEALISETSVATIGQITQVSVLLFILSRFVLAVGESGNFPAAVKATAEFFPKKDRAFATSIFNSGSTVGALAAPVTIPIIAYYMGWEMAFVLIGLLGFIWMGIWIFIYKKPHEHPKINAAELRYIHSDDITDEASGNREAPQKMSLRQAFAFRQTWAFAIGKFMTDGVWWFLLFWAPRYLETNFGMKTSDPQTMVALVVLYGITLLSIYGGYLPSVFIKKGMDPYQGRMRAMLIFAFIPVVILFAQPLGNYFNSFWLPVLLIGIAAAAHQSWSANIFTTVSDMFPKSAVATIVGIGSMAGGISSFLINKGSGALFEYAEATKLSYLGFVGKPAGYFIVFTLCAFAYLLGWCFMKMLVPKYKLVEFNKMS